MIYYNYYDYIITVVAIMRCMRYVGQDWPVFNCSAKEECGKFPSCHFV